MSWSGSADLDEDVGECRGTAEVGEGGGRQHVDGGASAVRSLPVTGRCHHDTWHDIGRDGGESFERAAIIEHAYGGARDDPALFRIVRVEKHRLFLAGLGSLRREIAIVRIE